MSWEGSDRRARLPRDWPQRVAAVKARDGYRCTWFDDGVRCSGGADEVDHRRRGDDHALANLRSLCTPHHRKKTAAEGNAARWQHQRQRPERPHPGLKQQGGGG